MYRHKKRNYNNSFAIASTEQSVYDLFNTIRHHSKYLKDFVVELDNICTNLNLKPEDIRFQGSSLLFFSAIYENHDVFQFLLEKFPQSFKHEIPQCLLYVYPNKSPEILQCALSHYQIVDSEDNNYFLNRISKNCFRTENIQIVSKWIQLQVDNQLISPSDINLFIENLIINKNKPFLSESCKEEFFKKYLISNIKNHEEFIIQNQFSDFLYLIIKNEHKQPSTQPFIEEEYDLRYLMHSDKYSSQKEKSNEKNIPKSLPKNKTIKQNLELTKNTMNTVSVQPTITLKKRMKIN